MIRAQTVSRRVRQRYFYSIPEAGALVAPRPPTFHMAPLRQP